MQGKILSPQLIISDDGKRYEYDKNDVVNLGNKDLAVLTGSQVDFVSFDERVAKSIYIIAENLNVSGILSADSISSARLSALWGIGLLFFHFIPYSVIPYIGKIIIIVSFVLYSMAIYSVSKTAVSKSLFKNYIISVIISFLGFFLFFMLAPSGAPSTSGFIAMGLLGAMIILIAAIYLYEIHYELARLSGSSLFLWAFWIYIVSVFLCFVFIMSFGFAFFFFFLVFAGFITFAVFAVPIIVLVLLFVAWWRFKKLEKR